MRNSAFRKKISRLFHAKNIVVVSQHNVDHYALSFRLQMLVLLLVLAFVGVVSFSTGRYIQAHNMLEEKDKTIKHANEENEKISNNFALLRNDLISLSEAEGQEGLSDYAQFVIDQYRNSSASKSMELDSIDLAKDGDKLVDRIHFLESQLENEQIKHLRFIDSIRRMAQGKIQELEKVMGITGMKKELSGVMADVLEEQFSDSKQTVEDQMFQGGPFLPYDEGANSTLEEQVVNEVSYLISMVDVIDALPISKPMKGARFTSGFGRRIDPFKKKPANHSGIDFAGPMGAKIYATAPGRIVSTSYRGGYGRTVDIRHSNGFLTRYSHLSKALVKKGQKVDRGDPIGIQGSTGRSTGHHLHYEVRFKGKAYDPAKFIKAGKYVSEKFK